MIAGLAISNIAWPPGELMAAAAIARQLGLDGIELAPHNLFGRWDVSDAEVIEVRTRLADHGLVCPALQGILFGAPSTFLFGSDEEREALASQLAKVARIAALLGASACVFGAPRNRDPGDTEPEAAWETARRFFAKIGPVFADLGTSLAIEANARTYGCRFLVTTSEAIEFVRAVDSPGIRLQIDTGTIFLEGEHPSVIEAAAPLAAHAHVSQPQLSPIGTDGIDHHDTAAALKRSGYGGFLSIEMRCTPDWEQAMRRAVELVRDQYL